MFGLGAAPEGLHKHGQEGSRSGSCLETYRSGANVEPPRAEYLIDDFFSASLSIALITYSSLKSVAMIECWRVLSGDPLN